MEHLKNFRDVATELEKEQLAAALGTNTTYLFSHLGRHRRILVEQAARIESETATIALNTGGKTPVIYRDMTCDACAKCPLACAARAAQGLA